jgi:hypothetical protein
MAYETRYCAFVDILGFRGLVHKLDAGTLDETKMKDLFYSMQEAPFEVARHRGRYARDEGVAFTREPRRDVRAVDRPLAEGRRIGAIESTASSGSLRLSRRAAKCLACVSGLRLVGMRRFYRARYRKRSAISSPG